MIEHYYYRVAKRHGEMVNRLVLVEEGSIKPMLVAARRGAVGYILEWPSSGANWFAFYAPRRGTFRSLHQRFLHGSWGPWDRGGGGLGSLSFFGASDESLNPIVEESYLPDLKLADAIVLGTMAKRMYEIRQRAKKNENQHP